MATKKAKAKDLSVFLPKVEGKDGKYNIRNIDNSLCGVVYYSAKPYIDGFAEVQLEEGGKIFYRDLIGNEHSTKTEAGAELYRLFKGEINVDEMKFSDFRDDSVVSFVKSVIALRHSDELNSAKKDDKSLKDALNTLSNDANYGYLDNQIADAKERTARLSRIPGITI